MYKICFFSLHSLYQNFSWPVSRQIALILKIFKLRKKAVRNLSVVIATLKPIDHGKKELKILVHWLKCVIYKTQKKRIEPTNALMKHKINWVAVQKADPNDIHCSVCRERFLLERLNVTDLHRCLSICLFYLLLKLSKCLIVFEWICFSIVSPNIVVSFYGYISSKAKKSRISTNVVICTVLIKRHLK
jgi:hypothetical protein